MSAGIDLAINTESRPIDEIVLVAQAAERAGIRTLWLTEGTRLDVFSVLAVVADRTEQIGLGTGIVNTFSRTPLALAQSSNTILEILGAERTFALGLGSSGKSLIEKFYGVPFTTPMARLEEYVRTIDHIFSTGSVPGPQQFFQSQGVAVARRGSQLADRNRLSVFVAGLSPRSIDITARYADGWLPIWQSKSRGAKAVAELESSARDAGRGRPQICAYIYGVVSDDEALIALVRGTLAWYIAANGTVYANLFERVGYGAEVERITALWRSGDHDAATRAVTREMLEDVSLMGEGADFSRRVTEFTAMGIDRVVLQFPPSLGTEVILSMIDKLPQE